MAGDLTVVPTGCSFFLEDNGVFSILLSTCALGATGYECTMSWQQLPGAVCTEQCNTTAILFCSYSTSEMSLHNFGAKNHSKGLSIIQVL